MPFLLGSVPVKMRGGTDTNTRSAADVVVEIV
jgi:hypothetical protein